MNKQRRMAHVTLQLYKEMDPIITSVASTMSTCTKGCSYCCYQLLIILLPEALLIAEYLLTARPNDVEALLGRMQKQRELLKHTDYSKAWYFLQQTPCAFLEDSLCSIYPVRPFNCRSYLAVTPPSLCGDPSGNALIGTVNLSNTGLSYAVAINNESISADIRLLTAPLPVILPLAIAYLRDGRETFEQMRKEAQGTDSADFWTDNFLKDGDVTVILDKHTFTVKKRGKR